MSDDLVFYTNPMSRGRIVRWMLEEVGQPYRTELVDYSMMKGPAYLAINPMGKVPALQHGETVITECGAICAYLADAFPQANLAPAPGSRQRGSYYRWLFYAAGPVEQAVTNKALGVEVPPDRQRMMGYGCYEHVMDTLEGALDGRRYIAGDSFTAADLYLGSQLGWGLQFGTVDKRQTFIDYVKGLMERPAAIRARGLDDALMPAPQPA